MSVKNISVGVTDCARYTNYERWLLDANEHYQVKVIRLSYKLRNLDDIQQCQGILLTGGEDVNPNLYKRPDLRYKLELTDIDEQRDEFEWQVIDRALELKLPILGICRGLQLINVHQGGTLIYDIPTVLNFTNHAKFNGIDQRHSIDVVEDSLLNRITGTLLGEVNSSHHQSIDHLAETLFVCARAQEPVIEAIEWKNPTDRPFFLGVQWHPERMINLESPFSYNIRQSFLEHVYLDSN